MEERCVTCAGEIPITAVLRFRRIVGVSRDALTPLGSTNVARFRRPTVPMPNWSPSDGIVLSSSSKVTSSWVSSASPSFSSDVFGVQAMINTPAKVAAQPYKNVTISWKVAFWKSPYKTAEPVMAERVKRTNWMGMTTWNPVNLLRFSWNSPHFAIETHKCPIEVANLAHAS